MVKQYPPWLNTNHISIHPFSVAVPQHSPPHVHCFLLHNCVAIHFLNPETVNCIDEKMATIYTGLCYGRAMGYLSPFIQNIAPPQFLPSLKKKIVFCSSL